MAAMSPTLTKFMQKFVRGDKEGILLKDAADDDHRVGPQDVNYGVSSKLAEMVGTDNCVFVPTPHFIYPRLELNYIIQMRSAFNYPIHTTANAAQREAADAIAARQLLERRNHAIRIETPFRKVDFGISPNLQLSALLRSRCINARGRQAL